MASHAGPASRLGVLLNIQCDSVTIVRGWEEGNTELHTVHTVQWLQHDPARAYMTNTPILDTRPCLSSLWTHKTVTSVSNNALVISNPLCSKSSDSGIFANLHNGNIELCVPCSLSQRLCEPGQVRQLELDTWHWLPPPISTWSLLLPVAHLRAQHRLGTPSTQQLDFGGILGWFCAAQHYTTITAIFDFEIWTIFSFADLAF